MGSDSRGASSSDPARTGSRNAQPPATATIARAATAGRTAWWLNSVLAQCSSPDDFTEHVQDTFYRFSDEHHRLSTLEVIGALRTRGIHHVHLAVVEAGDPLGLPGPAEVTRAAVAAGLALTTRDGSWTWIPALADEPLRWFTWPSEPGVDPIAPLGDLGQARRLMREAMLELTSAMPSLAVDKQARSDLVQYRRFQGPPAPPGLPQRAAEVADSALRVWWLTIIATDLAHRQHRIVPEPVRRLRPLARRSVAVAFSTPMADSEHE